MPVFQIDVTDEDGVEYRDECVAFDQHEAKIAVESLGYTLHRIRIKRFKTLVESISNRIDRIIHPRKYDPATAYEYMLAKERRARPKTKT